MCPLIRGVHFSKVGKYQSYFRKFITFIPIFAVVNASGRHQGSLWAKKKKKEMMLNCCNLKFLKIELVKPIIVCFLFSTLIFSNLNFMATREFLSSFDGYFRFTNLSSTCANFNNFNIFTIGITIIIFDIIII